MRLSVAIMIFSAAGLLCAGGCRDSKPDKKPAESSAVRSGTSVGKLPTKSAPFPTFYETWPGGPPDAAKSRDWRDQARSYYSAVSAAAGEVFRDPALCLAWGDAALARGDSAAAALYFRRAHALDPENAEATRGLTIALVAAGRSEEAIPLYLQLLERDDRDNVTRFNLAVANSRLGNWGAAEQAYRRMLKDNEQDARAAYNLATLLQTQGKLADARDAWQRVTQISPMLAGAHASLAEVYMDLAEPELALAEFAKASNLEPQVVRHWINLGTAARAAGKLGSAVAAYQRALTLSEEDADVWRELGLTRLEIYRATGDAKHLADAISNWRKSLAIKADQPDVKEWISTYSAALNETQPVDVRRGLE